MHIFVYSSCRVQRVFWNTIRIRNLLLMSVFVLWYSPSSIISNVYIRVSCCSLYFYFLLYQWCLNQTMQIYNTPHWLMVRSSGTVTADCWIWVYNFLLFLFVAWFCSLLLFLCPFAACRLSLCAYSCILIGIIQSTAHGRRSFSSKQAASWCTSEVVQHCGIFFYLLALVPTVRLRLVVCSMRTRRCGDFIYHRVRCIDGHEIEGSRLQPVFSSYVVSSSACWPEQEVLRALVW